MGKTASRRRLRTTQSFNGPQQFIARVVNARMTLGRRRKRYNYA